MKKFFVPARYMISAFVICTLCASCDNDDNGSPILTPTHQIGSYEGRAEFLFISPREEGQSGPETVVQAAIDADSIRLEDFPVEEIIRLIVGDENADNIVETIGQVDYNISYDAMQEEGFIHMKLSPKPLVIILPIEASSKEEATELVVNVSIVAPQQGTYDLNHQTVCFDLGIESVSLDGTPLDILPRNLTASFDFNRLIPEHNK